VPIGHPYDTCIDGGMDEPIVVTGLGCISGLGHTADAFVDGFLKGRTAIAPADLYAANHRAGVAGLVSDFRADAYLNPLRLRRVDRIGQFALAACRLALEDAGLLDQTEAGRDATGVVIGSYTAGLRSTVDYLRNLLTQGALGASALNFSNTVGNAAASLCALEFRLRGPNVTLSNKEASSLAAMATASAFLGQRRATAIVTGGVDDLEPMFCLAHERFGVLARGGDTAASRPFDRRRDGFVPGEGAFFLVLESAAAASDRGARVYGTVVATGAAASDVRLNDWSEDPADLARCMRLALEAGGVRPDDIRFVMASANSTRVLDRAEAEAITDVFGARGVPVGSVKGAIGESGASGAASVLAAVHALRRGVIPPATGCEQLDEDCPVDVAPVARSLARPPDGGLAMVNSFASGGTNYSLLIGRPPVP